jgi:hypothetical protein
MVKKKQTPAVAEKLRDLKHAVPFQPFRIKTASGETFTLTRAERFMISPLGSEAMFYPKEDGSLHWLDLEQVVAIEPARNGGGRRKRQSKRRDKQ